MDIFALAERLMRMDDAAWERHASPLSVWTRVAALPLLVLAIWSRVWLGGWCLVPVAAVLVFVYVNPRLFPAPARRDSWAARATYGERLFLARRQRPVPRHHQRAALVLTAVSVAGILPLAHGLWRLEVWPTLFGLALVMGGKLWFCDRMVWLHDDLRNPLPDDGELRPPRR